MKERDYFPFFRSFRDALDDLPTESQAVLYKAIADYSLDGIEPMLKGIEATIWKIIRPNLEASRKKYTNGCKGAEHGVKGGNPNFVKGKPNPYYSNEDNPTHNPTHNHNKGISNKDKGISNKDDGIKEDRVVGDESPDPPTIPFVEIEEVKPTHQTKKFVPPTLEQVQGYIVEKGLQNVDAERFFYFYESNGWKVGRNQMKSWQMALQRWNRDDNNRSNKKSNFYGRNAATDAKSERDAELAKFLNSKLG